MKDVISIKKFLEKIQLVYYKFIILTVTKIITQKKIYKFYVRIVMQLQIILDIIIGNNIIENQVINSGPTWI